jgi:hypothetical protein
MIITKECRRRSGAASNRAKPTSGSLSAARDEAKEPGGWASLNVIFPYAFALPGLVRPAQTYAIFARPGGVAKIESDFDPKQRTGSPIGLFQLSKREFEKYGSGNITDPRDNAVAAAYKLSVEAKLFELDTHKKATLSDIYLVHQQGVQGAAEHVDHPERIAWESMCATDEGGEKGKKWSKRAIWGNTLPKIKHIWKSVTKLTTGAFVAMWHQRVDHFCARYSEANAEKKDRQ